MRQEIILNALCVLIVLAALGATAWVVVTGQVMKEGIDSLFLISVCLLMAAIFAVIPLQSIRKGALQEILKARTKKPIAEPAVKPSSEPKFEEVAPREPQEPSS